MTDNKSQDDLKQGFDDSCLVDGLVSGPRKSDVYAQFVGRINRRNTPPPVIAMFAPTGKAHVQLHRQLGQSVQHVELPKMDETLEADVLKLKF